MTSLVRYDVDGQVATITLDSPKNRNALSRALVSELIDALTAAGQDAEIRVAVLTHTGTVFCSGADLSEAGSGSMSDATTAMTDVMTTVVELGKPVIAKVNGHVRAGGMGIVGACDIAVASETASFAFTEARIGLAPAIISMTTLDLMQPRAAGRYCLTGETFGGIVAAQTGLITEAASSGSIDDVVARLAEQICETSPQGAAETKRLLTDARRRRIAADSPSLTALSARLFASEEAQEGIHAFLERRPPAWRR
ncbi:MAG TPA: enoyl-CoA hydratase family protein [Streptosporangiaceae bacterium]